MRILNPVLAVAALLAAAPTVPALSDPGDIAKFQGVWIRDGAVSEQRPRGSAATAPNFEVVIRETKSGFDMNWKMLGRDKAEWISARFSATDEPSTFTASHVDPPLRGKERLWARLAAGRLVVLLSRRGVASVASVARYELAVSGGRMTFDYTLSRGGEELDHASGTLSKAKVVL